MMLLEAKFWTGMNAKVLSVAARNPVRLRALVKTQYFSMRCLFQDTYY
jgi:hypothetical protein